ncbi:MAG TPA: ATP-binding protein [Armatimonadota bacterium]|jgi:hypothetical protein
MRELSLHLLDLARNSLEAGAASIDILVREDPARDELVITVADDGRGMDEEAVRRATDAFFTSRRTRKMGLGLALWRGTCERSGGGLEITSAPGAGTTVTGRLQLTHWDRPPLGDMGGVLQALACEAPAVHLRYRHEVGARHFDFDTRELQQELQEVPVCDPTVLHWLRGWVREELAEIGSQA